MRNDLKAGLNRGAAYAAAMCVVLSVLTGVFLAGEQRDSRYAYLNFVFLGVTVLLPGMIVFVSFVIGHGRWTIRETLGVMLGGCGVTLFYAMVSNFVFQEMIARKILL